MSDAQERKDIYKVLSILKDSQYCIEDFKRNENGKQFLFEIEQRVKLNISENLNIVEKLKLINYDIINLSFNIVKTIIQGKKILIFGNGGSASDSQHFAAEMVNRFKYNRHSYPAISLNTDTSIITSISNDFGYEYIFKRQIECLGNQGDMAIGISTSGNSKNVILGLKEAFKNGLCTVSFIGKNNSFVKEFSEIVISVDSDDTPRIQECHILIIHIICDLVERIMEGIDF